MEVCVIDNISQENGVRLINWLHLKAEMKNIERRQSEREIEKD